MSINEDTLGWGGVEESLEAEERVRIMGTLAHWFQSEKLQGPVALHAMLAPAPHPCGGLGSDTLSPSVSRRAIYLQSTTAHTGPSQTLFS